MEAQKTYKLGWQQHLAVVSLLSEAPSWQLEGLATFMESITPQAAFTEWFRAFRALDRAAQLHLGYALRQRGGTGARILAEQHGAKPEFRYYLHICQILEIQLPEGF